LGEPLSRLCFEGPEEELKLTRNTQPALLTVSIAAWQVLRGAVPAPAIAAGHSLGEYSALVAAGVLSFPDALRAVRLRGEAMQAAVPVGSGGMAAVIGLPSEAVAELCEATRQTGEVLVPANLNAPDQIVVAGSIGAIDRLIAAAPQAGAKRALPLPVSAPFHCPLMAPAAAAMTEFLAAIPFAAPQFPVISNVDARVVSSGAEARETLIRQIVAPVRWVETMRAIETGAEVPVAIEIGPGRVLAGLSRRINDRLRCHAGGTPDELNAAVAALAAPAGS
jgi:[acyl-carrier-protein] S-malonyltransferase